MVSCYRHFCAHYTVNSLLTYTLAQNISARSCSTRAATTSEPYDAAEQQCQRENEYSVSSHKLKDSLPIIRHLQYLAFHPLVKTCIHNRQRTTLSNDTEGKINTRYDAVD